ncbi:MAG: hypothetical protein ACK5MD_05685 [Flavobacteriales bacterium]
MSNAMILDMKNAVKEMKKVTEIGLIKWVNSNCNIDLKSRVIPHVLQSIL